MQAHICRYVAHMSHEIGQNVSKPPILSDFFKKIAIFCNFLHTAYPAICPMNSGLSNTNCIVKASKIEKNCNFCAHSFLVHMSRICPMKLTKNAHFLGNSAFFSKKCQFFAIFCNFCASSCGLMCELTWVHMSHDLG